MATAKNKKKERPQRGGEILLIDLENVDFVPNWNERIDFGDIDELAQSIKENGVSNPLKGHLDRKSGKYLISSGHRRLKAIRLLSKKGFEIKVPIISDASQTEEERVLSQITDNSGKRFNPVEESAVINRLIDYDFTDSEISKKTGFSKVYISNLKLLHSAPQKLKDLILNNVIKSTLAMKVLREEKDFAKAQELIESTIANSQEKDGKKKITEKDIQKQQGKVNSYSALKKSFRIAKKKKLVPREDKTELIAFIKNVHDGQFSLHSLIEELYYPEVMEVDFEVNPNQLDVEKESLVNN